MAHKLQLIRDGLVRLAFIGDIGEADVDAFIQDLQPYLDTLSEGDVLDLLVDGGPAGKMSSAARRKFSKNGEDRRYGLTGTYNVKPFNRVFALFMMKITGRQNIRLFDSEEEAIAWLNEGEK
jgi:hypothetical protein